jgi:hypothetical protein
MYRLWVNIKILVASHTNESYLMGIVDGNCRVEIYIPLLESLLFVLFRI